MYVFADLEPKISLVNYVEKDPLKSMVVIQVNDDGVTCKVYASKHPYD